MNKIYQVEWTPTALTELASMYYPLNIQQDIYIDSFERLSYLPTLTAKNVRKGKWRGYWYRLGLHKVTLIFKVDEQNQHVAVHAVKHKRQDLDFKK